MLCSTDADNCNGSNVKVVVRIRPQNEREKDERCVVNAVSNQVLVFDPAEDVCEFNGQKSSAIVRGDITRRRFKNLNFAFDYVFDPDSMNVDLYEHTSKSILDGLLNGYNCSVFAYGATGSGKTYTMLGTKDQPGITFLTLMDLYQRIEAIKSEKVCEVAVSYLEVYNEQIKDLLNGKCQLPIREDPKTGVVIPGLSLHKPQNEQDLLYMLYNGNKNRTQHPTDANAESSRSHAVFQVFIRQSDRTANLVTSVHIAKLCLVDLAGSERGTVTKNNISRKREGANINRSLLALGNVINMLADNKVKAHIPYRDSKLTRLLKDSIGGNCRTVMIAAISPSAKSYEDTYNTLKYADRAKHIRADLKKNIMNVKSHFSKYGKIIESLRQEVSELKLKLQNFESTENQKVINIPQLQSIEESKRLQEVLYNIFVHRKSVRKEILEYESILRTTEWKIFSKKQCLNKVNWVYDYNCLECQSKKEKGRRTIEISQKRIKSIEDKIEASRKNFANNEEQLQRWKAEKDLISGEMSQSLDVNLRAHHLEVELTDNQRFNKHLKKVISLQDRDSRIKDKTINNLTKTMKRFYSVIKNNGLLTSDIQQDYNQVVEQVLGDKEITWADENQDDNSNINGITLEKIIHFPLLNSVSHSQSLDVNVKKRRDSLTPILSRAKNFLDSTEDAKIGCAYIEDSCTPIMSKSTPHVTNNFPSQRNEMSKFSSNVEGLQLQVESQVSSKVSNLSDSEFDLKCKNTKKEITFSPCLKSPNVSVCQTPKTNNNGNVGQAIFQNDCCIKETVTYPLVEKKVLFEQIPFASIKNKPNHTPSQILSPADLPSTRNEAHLLLVGGGTITKTQPSMELGLLPTCKVKPVISVRSPAAKENRKTLHRHGVPSMCNRKISTGSKKAPSRNLTRTQLMTASTGNNRFLSKLPSLRAEDAPSSRKSRRVLFSSKSASDFRS